ncbi:TonB-dependent receptor plug domain-containing protein, partial [candidate division GN15 bacterium]|nr:TonB-dependent receptor plug domain-containing protein [candidate division GN15 bacterium]
MIKRLSYPLAIFLVLVVSWSLTALPVAAKVTGKISGMVEDSETGNPIIGASVRVTGTNLVTKTDEDGEYFIINVPVGKYDISVTHVGFETMTQQDVRVLLDLTTPVDFAMAQVAVELQEEMVVRAAAPIIQKDLTASRVIFTEERLKNLPNVITVQSILTHYPGVIEDGEQALHVRGGRSGQISYYYDGFSVQDPFTASAGIRIMPSSLEELSLTSGGFTAEYGEALSGVVSAVTREGTANYRGRLRTYKGATHPYDVNTGEWGKLKSITNRSVSFDLSGPVPGLDRQRYTFFTAGEYLRDDSYLPHNWYTSLTGTSKLSMQPTSRMRLKTNFTYNDADGAIYDHRDVNGVSYDLNLDGLPVFERKAYLLGVSGNYFFNERSILSLTLNRFYTRTQSGPAHLLGTHWSQWPGYSEDANGVYDGTIHSENYGWLTDYNDPASIVGFTKGSDFDPTYSWRESKYNSLSSVFINQLTKTNQLKAGFEYRKYSVGWDFKQFYNSQPYGELYSSKPTYASLFVEDKLEYDAFVLNLGLRLDHRDADISYNYTPEDTVASYREAESKTQLSPRLGVSFPVAEHSVLHFNYGVYYQVPQYRYLYVNLQGDRNSGLPLLG